MNMKKIVGFFMVALLALMALPANAQLKFGIKGGVNISSVHFNSDVLKADNVTEVDAGGNPVGEPVSYGNTKDIIKCATATFKTMEPRVVVCPGVGDKLETVGSLTLTMDANNNVTVEEVSGKAAITNASGTYKIEGDYDYVAKVGTRAPQFDLEYTYENGGKYYHVVEKLVLRQDPLYDLRVETW